MYPIALMQGNTENFLSQPVVDLIVKGGALGLAAVLAWMGYSLLRLVLQQKGEIGRARVFLVVFFILGTLFSLVGGALLHRHLNNPKVAVTVLLSPEFRDGEELPEIRATAVGKGVNPREYLLTVREGDWVTIELSRLLERARKANEVSRQQDIVAANLTNEGGASEIR